MLNEKILKSIGLFTFGSAFLAILFCFSLPTDVYPEFMIFPLRRIVKYTFLIGWTTLLLMVLSYFPRVVGILFLIIFFLPSAFVVYLAHTFRLRLDYGVVSDIAETNWIEFFSFLNSTSVLWIFSYVALMSLLGWNLGKLRIKLPQQWFFVFLAGGVLMGMTQVEFLRVRIAPVYNMERLLDNLLLYHQNDAVILKELVKLDDAEIKWNGHVRNKESLPIVFLHIGESVRADHTSFNGYARETMPCVRKEFDAGNVLSFPKCVSFSTSTRLSVLGILTPAQVLDPVIRQGSFIPYLNVHGIETLGFYSSMPKEGTYYDSALVKITRKLQERIFTMEYSDTLHETVSNRISKIEGGAFLLYYGEGAHVPCTRYNHEKYSVFMPDATKLEEDVRRVNAYDNCLVATDAFIGNALAALRDKNAIYIYVSDHGEMLGEDGYWVRNPDCYRRKETRHVLSFIWASKRFQKEHAGQWRQLKANHKRLAIISHDVYYHSILSLFNIQNEFYDASCDIFSSKAESFMTEMPKATEFGPLRFDGVAVKWRGIKNDETATREYLRKRAKNSGPVPK